MVRRIPKDGSGGSHSEKEENKEKPDDQFKDGGSSESQSEENHLPLASGSSESHNLEKQLLSNAKGCVIVPEDITHPTHHNHRKPSMVSFGEFSSIFSLSYVQSLYITIKLL